jgi:hypothetical protein
MAGMPVAADDPVAGPDHRAGAAARHGGSFPRKETFIGNGKQLGSARNR